MHWLIKIEHLEIINELFFYSKRGYNVRSFGTGSQVKLPGATLDKPNIYDFNTTYDEMYRDLMRKDPELYPWVEHFTNMYHDLINVRSRRFNDLMQITTYWSELIWKLIKVYQ